MRFGVVVGRFFRVGFGHNGAGGNDWCVAVDQSTIFVKELGSVLFDFAQHSHPHGGGACVGGGYKVKVVDKCCAARLRVVARSEL